ncbi:MAG: helix-turn-helix transcriptional regulator [Geminicoccaceae bacterium]|nr:helix-turn-helix transcriptional regulator [Geminicoccaceae bacterium]
MPDAHDLLTTAEVADLLRIKERKVYDLVAGGLIPYVRVTGKLLFPRALLDAWIARNSVRGGEACAPRPNVLVGSHDPLLDWALREAGTGLAAFCDGSLDGLHRLAQGEAVAAGLHLPGEGEDGPNVEQVQAALAGRPIVLLEWARRSQGLIVPAGNPKGIGGLADLEGLRFVPRQPGAGARLLFERLCRDRGVDPEALPQEPPARSEAEVALAVAEGRAEAGFGLAAPARQFRLGFVPLAEERFDLLVWRPAYFEPPLQRLFAFCRTAPFLERARSLAGYDVGGLGTVRFNAP